MFKLKKLLAFLSIAMVAMLVLAACGDDAEDDEDADAGTTGTTTTGTTSSGGSAEVTAVKMVDAMKFEPASQTVKAGEEVTFELSNDGAIKHNYSVDEAEVSKDLDGGKAETLTFTAPTEPGEYKIYCDEPGHTEAGMVGTLVVE